MNTNKEIAYLDFKISSNHFIFPFPALVGNAGAVGEYSIAYNPNSEKYETGFFPECSTGIAETINESDNLNDAITNLNEKFYTGVRDTDMIEEFASATNTAIATPIDFIFTATHHGLSSNPSLTGFKGEDEFYVVFEEDFIIGAMWGNPDPEFSGEDYPFRSFDEAKAFLISKFAIRISDKSKREVENFLAYARCSTPA